MLDELKPRLIEEADILRLRFRLKLLKWISLIVLIMTQLVPVYVAQDTALDKCTSAQLQLGRYLFGSSLKCLDIATVRLAMYGLLILMAVWFASACVAEYGWRGLKEAIFSPDGNNAQILTLFAYVAFLLATAVNVKYSHWPQYLISTMFYVSRNVLTGMVFNWVVLRLAGIKNIESYLREQVTRYSDGLPYLQMLALFLAFMFWRIFG